MLGNIIAAGALIIILFLAIRYIVRAKKKGVKCIGCPAGDSCSGSCCTIDPETLKDEIDQQRNKNMK